MVKKLYILLARNDENLRESKSITTALCDNTKKTVFCILAFCLKIFFYYFIIICVPGTRLGWQSGERCRQSFSPCRGDTRERAGSRCCGTASSSHSPSLFGFLFFLFFFFFFCPWCASKNLQEKKMMYVVLLLLLVRLNGDSPGDADAWRRRAV